VIDAIVPEPLGGAHRDAGAIIADVGTMIEDQLRPLLLLDGVALKQQRREKFLEMGQKGL
jgi:acetyl-CoA carboxylase carboxyl transferase subunit alpha